MSIQAIKSLKSNVSDEKMYKNVTESDLSKVNNFFEVVTDKPARVFIDLDGYLHEDQLPHIDQLHQDILTQLKTLEDVSIMSSSSQSSNKLSFRVTYINEYCANMTDLKKVVEKSKFKQLKKLLKTFK